MNSCRLWHSPHCVWHPPAYLGQIPLVPNAPSLSTPHCPLSWSPSKLSPCSDTLTQPLLTSGTRTATRAQHISWGQVPCPSELWVSGVSARSLIHVLTVPHIWCTSSMAQVLLWSLYALGNQHNGRKETWPLFVHPSTMYRNVQLARWHFHS